MYDPTTHVCSDEEFEPSLSDELPGELSGEN